MNPFEVNDMIYEVNIKFHPTPGVFFIAYYASDSIIFDLQIINQNYWDYRRHWQWVKAAYSPDSPPFEFDESLPF